MGLETQPATGFEKQGALQLENLTWEALHGLVRHEVTSQTHIWSDALENTKSQLNCRLDEFQGVLSTVDKEHTKSIGEVAERQGHTESKLADVSVEVHQYGAASRGELRRVSVELDEKITALVDRDNSAKLELHNKIDRETKDLRERHGKSTTELLAKMQDLQQQLIEDRAERQASQTRCMHYADRQVAAAMASAELEQRFQAIRDSVSELDQKLQNVEISVRSDLIHYSQNLCAELSTRMQDIVQLADKRHVEINALMHQCDSAAQRAADGADKALRLVDESLHEKVHTASRSLMEQIEAAAKSAAVAGLADDSTKEQHAEKRAQELQAGFYNLVAREALGTEIHALVDRATRRLQVVADDLAQRSVTIQEHVVAAEDRLEVALELARRQVGDIEALESGQQ